MQKRKRHTGWIAALCIAVVIAAIAGVYCRFGGFGTGGCADTEEFSKYAVNVSALTVPDEAQIIALGEATHGNSRILISGHNNHIMRCENAGTPVLGSLLAKELGSGYYAIGTDFFKSVCNLPKPYTGERITHTFYSHDPLAKASKKCGLEVGFLDFSKVPEDSALTQYLAGSIPMGSLGEAYSVLMNFVPRNYRVQRTPQDTYDAMIFVANATPIEIKPEK